MQKPAQAGIRWTEYKTLRQYPALGSMLEEFRTYGYRAGVESLLDKDNSSAVCCHDWLTEEHGIMQEYTRVR